MKDILIPLRDLLFIKMDYSNTYEISQEDMIKRFINNDIDPVEMLESASKTDGGLLTLGDKKVEEYDKDVAIILKVGDGVLGREQLKEGVRIKFTGSPLRLSHKGESFAMISEGQIYAIIDSE